MSQLKAKKTIDEELKRIIKDCYISDILTYKARHFLNKLKSGVLLSRDSTNDLYKLNFVATSGLNLYFNVISLKNNKKIEIGFYNFSLHYSEEDKNALQEVLKKDCVKSDNRKAKGL